MLLAETDDQIKGLQEKLNSVQSVSEWLALNKQIYVSKLYKARYCKKFDKSKESDRPLSKPVLEQEDIHILLRHIQIPTIWSQSSSKSDQYIFFTTLECDEYFFTSEVFLASNGSPAVEMSYVEMKISEKTPEFVVSVYFTRANFSKVFSSDGSLIKKSDKTLQFYPFLKGTIKIQEIKDHYDPSGIFKLHPIKTTETDENYSNAAEYKNIEKVYKDIDNILVTPKYGACCAFIVSKLNRSESLFIGKFVVCFPLIFVQRRTYLQKRCHEGKVSLLRRP
ncbi:hypothetical protein RF11_13029 [Thelohanellus kitauei]|uniref:Uncharacterized protein n=1 Tax=Thelohanellus kitauei TaxID=669202 RepID=A0A0C2MXU7_THEKT|nr:hypothetical protein RF11_13029 [Thelohanellus kitauei]